MSNFWTQQEILDAGLITKEITYRGKNLLVREMPAQSIQDFFDKGVIKISESGDVTVDSTMINFIEIASVCLIDPETKDPMLSKDALKEMGFSLNQLVATTAMNITDWGEEGEPEENAKKG